MVNIRDRALLFAAKAHYGQLDKAGVPYIFHCLAVSERFKHRDFAFACAVLHDVIEDTDETIESVEKEFGTDVAFVVGLLTHKKEETYGKYILRISNSHIASLIKISDLEHNMDLRRVNWEMQEKDFERMKKYKKHRDALLSIT